MNLLAPAALALALLSVPIVLLYMLKLRRKDVPVSSTLLWTQLLRDRQSNTPWQRLRRQLLLFLQLLILAALVLALARPALRVPSVASGAALVLLDASASMNARDGGDGTLTRFEAARQEALSLIDNLPGSSTASVILVGSQPRLLPAADRAALRQALAGAQPEQGGADWAAAFSLAAGAASAAGAATEEGNRPTIVILSDGGLPESGLPPLPGEVRYLPVGRSDDNLALSALAVRSAADGPQLFAAVSNYGSQPRSAILSFYEDDQLFEAREVQVEPGQSHTLVLEDLPEGVVAPEGDTTLRRYTARLSAPEGSGAALDTLPVDDSAYAVYHPTSAGRALLATRGNLFLRQLLESLPGMQSFVVLPGEDGQLVIPEDAQYDLFILDGFVPETLPEGNLLLINPPANELFPSGDVYTLEDAPRGVDHPLTRFVDWGGVHILQARRVSLPDWGEALVTADEDPLVFVGETGSRRVVVVTFDLHDSDLPLQVAFPVLFSNLLEYLSPSSSLSTAETTSVEVVEGLDVRPGESVFIRPAGDATRVRVTAPDGQGEALTLEEGLVAYNQTGQPGLYMVTYPGNDTLGEDAFAVNLFTPAESAIRPRETLNIGQTSVTQAQPAAMGQKELWPWLAALALLVVLIEWWVYHRQQVAGGSRSPGLQRLRDGWNALGSRWRGGAGRAD